MREGVEEREPPPLHVQLQGGRGAGRRDPTTEERTDGRTDAAIPGDSLQGVLENEGGRGGGGGRGGSCCWRWQGRRREGRGRCLTEGEGCLLRVARSARLPQTNGLEPIDRKCRFICREGGRKLEAQKARDIPTNCF